MNVNSPHFEYEASLPGWSRARDMIAGEEALKAAGEKYLPRLDAQSDDNYAACRFSAACVAQNACGCGLAHTAVFAEKVARAKTCQILFGQRMSAIGGHVFQHTLKRENRVLISRRDEHECDTF